MKSITATLSVSRNSWETTVLSYAYSAIVLVSIAYAIILIRNSILLRSTNESTIAFSYLATHLIFLIIETVLWAYVARSALRLKTYTRILKGSEDGVALSYIADAMILGLVYVITLCLATSVKTLFIHTQYLKLVTSICNLVPIAFLLVSSGALLIGAMKLDNITRIAMNRKRWAILIGSTLMCVLAVVLYAVYFYHVASGLHDDDGLYHFALPRSRLLAAYVLPYGVAWLLGVLACMNLAHYAHNVEGDIYRKLFHVLYKGLLISFIGNYLIQLFTVSNLTTNRFSLGWVIQVFLLGLIIYGFLMIYGGTNQLYNIER